jgi:hypothetical protein
MNAPLNHLSHSCLFSSNAASTESCNIAKLKAQGTCSARLLWMFAWLFGVASLALLMAWSDLTTEICVDAPPLVPPIYSQQNSDDGFLGENFGWNQTVPEFQQFILSEKCDIPRFESLSSGTFLRDFHEKYPVYLLDLFIFFFFCCVLA